MSVVEDLARPADDDRPVRLVGLLPERQAERRRLAELLVADPAVVAAAAERSGVALDISFLNVPGEVLVVDYWAASKAGS